MSWRQLHIFDLTCNIMPCSPKRAMGAAAIFTPPLLLLLLLAPYRPPPVLLPRIAPSLPLLSQNWGTAVHCQGGLAVTGNNNAETPRRGSHLRTLLARASWLLQHRSGTSDRQK
jgi:hypothetical protein